MNKVKTAFWIVIFGFFMLIFFQNPLLFQSQQSIRINLYLFNEFKSPEVASAVFFLGFFLLGLLISQFFGFFERLRLKKKIKRLSAAADSCMPTMTSTEQAAVPLGDGSVEKKEDLNASAP